jgi:TRAP-type C4-dicarboxylate transport system permease large subunit
VKAAVPYAERFAALFKVWPVLLVFALVVGGIYQGWFTPTEGAAVGAAGTGFIAWMNKGLTRSTLVESFLVTAKSSAMIFFIILGAGFYNGFLALTQVPQEISSFVVSQGFSPWVVLTIILLILLTIPIFFPVIVELDFGMSQEQIAIWFGILVLIVVEVGLITPPVGMNLFVINAMDRSTPLVQTYKVVMYFVASDIARVILLVAFPAITLFWLRV